MMRNAVRALVRRLLWLYLRVYHRLDVEVAPKLRLASPYVVVASHFSLLDLPAFLAANPFHRPTTTIVKAPLMRLPVVAQILALWQAVPARRDGRDVAAVRHWLRVLEAGGGITITPEGRRARGGRLGPMSRVATRLVMRAAAGGIPVVPLVEIGTFEALPPGRWVPRPRKIHLVYGAPIRFDPAWIRPSRRDEAAIRAVAATMQAHLSALLPADRRPATGTAPLAGRPRNR